MKAIEEIKSRMMLGAWTVFRHRQAPTAQAVTEFRQRLLADIKAIAATGSAELIMAMEAAIVENDLKYYANSKAMKTSLNTALSEFRIVRRQLAIVDDLPAAGRPGAIQGHGPEFWPGQKPQPGPAPLPAAGRWTRPGRYLKATLPAWSTWINRRLMIWKNRSSRRANQPSSERKSYT